jgi:hypothetical protein
VTFYPVDRGEGQKVPGAFGRTDGQGRFVLRTFGDADGAAAGEFVVLVTKTVDENPPVESTKIDAPRPEPKFKSLLPAHAGKPNTTPLRVTIPPSGSHSFAISLADDPKASTIQPAGGK